MRVLHAAETIRGGIAAVLRLNIINQRERLGGNNIRVIVPACQAEDLFPVPEACVTTFKRRGRDIRTLLEFRRTLCNEIRDFHPDILHLHSSFAGMLGRTAPLIRRNGHKIIYTPHSWPFLMNVTPLKKKIYAHVEHQLSRFTEKIICVSRFEREQALSLGFADEKLDVIYNGVIDPGPPVRRRRPGDGPLRLLFVGRLDYQKGFDVLHEAMTRLDAARFHLTVVGSGVHDSPDIAHQPNITHLGWLNTQAVLREMRRADILVAPSRWEGFAVTPLEAMSCGLPVIASDIEPFKEVIVPGENGFLFKSGSAEALRDTIMKIDRASLAALTEPSYGKVKELFSDSQMCAATLSLYHNLLGRSEA